MKSPLRYPGGKGKLYSLVKNIMETNDMLGRTYVEPFSGGYSIGLQLLVNNDVQRAIINDYDYHIYAIWKCIFCKTKQFVKLIKNTPIDLVEWQKQKEIYENYKNYSMLEVGFSAFFLNRTNHSGVIKGGPIGGKDQKGTYKIDCRFNKDSLISFIEKISTYRDKVEIYNYSAETLIKKVIAKRTDELFINFDPPYVKKGKMLYTNYYNISDHEFLSELIVKKLYNAKWIMTYDECELIKELYKGFIINDFELKYSAGHIKKGKELLISNL